MISEKKYMVYCHTNKVNGKKYVGMTCQRPESRWSKGKGYVGCRYFSRAIQKYGWEGFTHEILVDSLSFDEACTAEKRFIKELRSLYCENGYNIDDGGSAPRILSPEGLSNMKLANSRGNHPKARPVVVFSLEGKKLNEFPCVRDAADYYGIKINYTSIETKVGTCHGFIIRFKEYVGDVDVLPEEDIYKVHDMSRFSGGNSPFAVPVALFDAKTGERVADFPSVHEADVFAGVRINPALTGRYKTCAGYICRYAKDVEGVSRLSESDLPVYRTTSKKVLQYDLDGNFIRAYDSLRIAADAVGVTDKAISACARHKLKSVGEFAWRFPDDSSPIERPVSTWDSRRDNGSIGRKIDQIDITTTNCRTNYP